VTLWPASVACNNSMQIPSPRLDFTDDAKTTNPFVNACKLRPKFYKVFLIQLETSHCCSFHLRVKQHSLRSMFRCTCALANALSPTRTCCLPTRTCCLPHGPAAFHTDLLLPMHTCCLPSRLLDFAAYSNKKPRHLTVDSFTSDTLGNLGMLAREA
jgi:hypothetical protein